MDQQETRVQPLNQQETMRAPKEFCGYLSNKCYLQYVFTFTAWEMAMIKFLQRGSLKVQTSVDVLIYSYNDLIFVRIFEFNIVTQSL